MSTTIISKACSTQGKDIRMSEDKPEKKNFLQNMQEILYGMASHDMSRYALRTRASMEHLFILITMGDMIGIPILPPYYSLRLLPYVVPQISTWKRRLLREKDVSDAMFRSEERRVGKECRSR